MNCWCLTDAEYDVLFRQPQIFNKLFIGTTGLIEPEQVEFFGAIYKSGSPGRIMILSQLPPLLKRLAMT